MASTKCSMASTNASMVLTKYSMASTNASITLTKYSIAQNTPFLYNFNQNIGIFQRTNLKYIFFLNSGQKIISLPLGFDLTFIILTLLFWC